MAIRGVRFLGRWYIFDRFGGEEKSPAIRIVQHVEARLPVYGLKRGNLSDAMRVSRLSPKEVWLWQ